MSMCYVLEGKTMLLTHWWAIRNSFTVHKQSDNQCKCSFPLKYVDIYFFYNCHLLFMYLYLLFFTFFSLFSFFSFYFIWFVCFTSPNLKAGLTRFQHHGVLTSWAIILDLTRLNLNFKKEYTPV